MQDTAAIQKLFVEIGGTFVLPVADMASRLSGIKAFVFDWDGVFHAGRKGKQGGNSFAEADSMGLNMLRFGHWLQHGALPVVAIVTGEQNPPARELAEREHFHGMYYGIKDKRKALQHLCGTYELQPAEVAFVFDDILDLSISEQVGLRMQVRRDASPLFRDHCIEKGYCDYITGQSPAGHAVREVCELILGLRGNYSEVIELRKAYEGPYAEYLALRQAVEPAFHTMNRQGLTQII